jgi:hypothetical protein
MEQDLANTPDDNEDAISRTLAALVRTDDEYSPREQRSGSSFGRPLSIATLEDALLQAQSTPSFNPPLVNRPNSFYMTGQRPQETQAPRPASEIFAGKWAGISAAAKQEQDMVEKYFQTIAQYEQQLQEMSRTPIDDNFKEELRAIEHWFNVLTEAEKTAAMYSLLKKSSPVQVRFFMNVLQQMASQDPVAMNLPNESWPRRTDAISRPPFPQNRTVGSQRNSVASIDDQFAPRLSVPHYDGSGRPYRERPASFHEYVSMGRNQPSRPPSFHERPASVHEGPASFHEATRFPSSQERSASSEDRRASIPAYYHMDERRHSPFEPTSKRSSQYLDESSWSGKTPRQPMNARTYSTPSINVYSPANPAANPIITPRSTSLAQAGSTSPGENKSPPIPKPPTPEEHDVDHEADDLHEFKSFLGPGGKSGTKGKVPEKFDVQQLHGRFS